MIHTYEEFINNILNTRGRNGVPIDKYKERHHIKPKCMGGNNDNNNLIDLYAYEHYEAHKLLALENPDNNKLQYAWWQMCVCKRDGREYQVSAEEYAVAKEVCNKIKINSMTGRFVSEETKHKQSEVHKGVIFTEKHKENISRYHADVSGSNNPQYGKPAVNRKSVYCVELDKTFGSMAEAALYVGLKSYAGISNCCHGKIQSSGKHPETGQPLHWTFIDINL